MLLLKKLTLENFLSHENTEIGFEPDTKVLIDGASGVGKSAIAEAITWALYGVARTDNRALVRRGAKKGSVTLELTAGDDAGTGRTHYIITRSIGAGAKHSLDVRTVGANGKETAHPTTGLRELQKWLESNLLGASYLLFINSVVYLQGGGDSFVGQTATRRKELLLELVNAENFDEYYEKAREMISEVEGVKTALSSEHERNLEWLGKNRERVSAKPALQVQLTEVLKEIGQHEDSKKALITTLAGMKGAAEQVHQLERTTAGANLRVASAQKEVARLRIIEAQLEGSKVPTEKDLMFAQETETLRIRLLKSKPVLFIDKMILELNALQKAAVCTNPDCPHQKLVAPKIASLTSEIADAQVKRIEWETQFESLPAEQNIVELSKLFQMSQELATLPEKQREVSELTVELERMMGLLEEARKNVDMEAKNTLETTLDDVETKLLSARSAESTLVGELSRIDQIESDIQEREAQIVVFNQQAVDIEDKLKKLLMVKEAFGSKGIKSVVVDYLIPRLEENVNSVLARLSDFRIRFDTQRASADGDSQVEGLFITIINEMGEEMAFESYSGGERLKITVAISEALASLQKVGFRIFDEVFMGLDDASTESFARVLDKMQARFNQVICISHLGAIKDSFDNVITVRKQFGISSI